MASELRRFGLLLHCRPDEPFGVALIEAMAAGLPVVATEIPGYLSVVESGLDSLTVRPKSPLELGVAMTVLARDPEL